MRDIHRVWALWWLAALPFILTSIVICIVTGVTITASSRLTWEHFFLLAMTAAFGYFIFWKHPRLRHFNKTFAEHEDNYRYEKEAQ